MAAAAIQAASVSGSNPHMHFYVAVNAVVDVDVVVAVVAVVTNYFLCFSLGRWTKGTGRSSD